MRLLGAEFARVAAVVGLASWVRLATAQANLGDVAGALRAIRSNNMIGQPVNDAYTATGNPGVPEKIPPLSDSDAADSNFHLIHTNESAMYKSGRIVLEGNCEFLVRGYRVTCDYATGNPNTGIFTLRGNIHIDGELFSIVEGRQVTVDFFNKTYEAIDAQAQLSPQLIQGGLKDKLYVSGHDSYGSQDQTTTLDGSFTTCNYPAPHYEIVADSIVIRPSRRAIFRKTKIKILGRTVFNLPFLSIPLNNRHYRNTPWVGESPDEGYFVKVLYGIPLKNPNYNLDTREDLMTKLGLGLGADYAYQALHSAGTASIYHIFGSSDDLTISNNHHQAFNWGTLSVQDDYQKDNYLVAPNSTSFNTRMDLAVPQGNRGSDRFSLTDAFNDSSGYSTSSDSFALADQRNFGTKTQTTLDVNYFGSSSQYQGESGQTTNETQRVDVHLTAQQDLNAAQAMIEYMRSVPIGTSTPGISASDETPVLSLQSDARRLFGNTIGQEFPFKTLVSWGDFQNPQTGGPISRAFFDVGFNKTDNSRSDFHVDTNGDFKQGVYSDGAAEYVLTFGTNLRYDLGRDTGVNVRYNYLEPFGYSPLGIDQTGKTDVASTNLNFRPFHALLIGAQSGYDLNLASEGLEPWQPAQLTAEFNPAKWFMLRGITTYDTFNHDWSTTQMDLAYVPGATKIALSSSYDGPTHTWTAANFYMDGLKWGRAKIATALNYNGYLRMFESEQVSVIYDLHCVEAIFEYQDNNTGFRGGSQFQFFIRLKAFPYDVPFDLGTRGQPLGFSNLAPGVGTPGG